MINRVKNNLAIGLTRVKWVATFLADRTKAGTSAAKLLYESSKLEERIDELYRDIGRRVMELQKKGGVNDIYTDFVVQQALDEIKNLRKDVDAYRKQARNVNDIPE